MFNGFALLLLLLILLILILLLLLLLLLILLYYYYYKLMPMDYTHKYVLMAICLCSEVSMF